MGKRSALWQSTQLRHSLLTTLVLLSLAGLPQALAADTSPLEGVLLFGIGIHVEPFGAQVSQLALAAGAQPSASATQAPSYHNPHLYESHVRNLLGMAELVERHGGRLTIQVQSPFTDVVATSGDRCLADLEARGHEIALHFHEQAHLGRDSEHLPAQVWSSVMGEQLALIRMTGVRGPIRYWSGGNLYPGLLQAAAIAGLDVYSDWKNPSTQSFPSELSGVHPWRPAEGTDGDDISGFVRHDPESPIVFLPPGAVDPERFADKRQIVAEGGEEAWFAALAEQLLSSLAAARDDRVNAYHITLHPGELRSLLSLERFLTDVVDPLVASGAVQWATFSQMADAFIAWEAANPEQEPIP